MAQAGSGGVRLVCRDCWMRACWFGWPAGAGTDSWLCRCMPCTSSDRCDHCCQSFCCSRRAASLPDGPVLVVPGPVMMCMLAGQCCDWHARHVQSREVYKRELQAVLALMR